MFGIIPFGVRAFFIDLVVGLLVALRPGRETRRLLRDRLVQFMDVPTEVLALPEEPVTLPDRGARVGAGAAQLG